MPKKLPSTADRLLSFRERLARHYAAVRKGKVGTRPSIEEFNDGDATAKQMALAIAAQEFAKHEAALAAEESFRKLGYKE